jgi:hypothetical protein
MWAQSRTLATSDHDSVHSNTEQKGEKAKFYVRSSAGETPNKVSSYVFIPPETRIKQGIKYPTSARLLTYFSYYLSTFSRKDLKTEHLKSGDANFTQCTL